MVVNSHSKNLILTINFEKVVMMVMMVILTTYWPSNIWVSTSFGILIGSARLYLRGCWFSWFYFQCHEHHHQYHQHHFHKYHHHHHQRRRKKRKPSCDNPKRGYCDDQPNHGTTGDFKNNFESFGCFSIIMFLGTYLNRRNWGFFK